MPHPQPRVHRLTQSLNPCDRWSGRFQFRKGGGREGGGGEGNCQELYEILTEEGKTKLSTRKSKILYDKEANDFFFLALQHFLIMT